MRVVGDAGKEGKEGRKDIGKEEGKEGNLDVSWVKKEEGDGKEEEAVKYIYAYAGGQGKGMKESRKEERKGSKFRRK